MKKVEFIDRYGADAYEAFKEYQKDYYIKRKEYIKNRTKQYKQEHKEENADWYREYRNLQKGRANYLLQSYKAKDKKYRNAICTITKDFIINEIFTKSCVYCGETDWKVLGCDRIDNNKPHTPDNVVCCCYNCNTTRQRKSFYDFLTHSSNYYPLVKR